MNEAQIKELIGDLVIQQWQAQQTIKELTAEIKRLTKPEETEKPKKDGNQDS